MFAARYAAVILLAWPLLAVAADPPTEPKYADRPLSAWVADLDDADPLVREEAIEVLAQMGAVAKPALARLEKIARAESPALRRRAALALWKIDGRTDLAVELYRAYVVSALGQEKIRALETLTQLGVPAKELTPHLADLLVDSEPALNAAIQPLVYQFGDEGVAALGEAVPRARGDQRYQVLSMISGLGATGRPLAPQLRKLLTDADLRARFAAVQTLWRLNDDRPGLKKLVVDATQGKDAALSEAAIYFALTVYPRPKEFAPVYEAAVKSLMGPQRILAVQALWQLEPASLKANLPILIEGLRNPSWVMAAGVLAEIGPAAKEALPVLLALAERPEGHGNLYMLGPTIARMGPDGVDPVLKLLASSNTQIQALARHALFHFGPEVVPKLVLVLKDSNTQMRRQVLQVLSSMARLVPECRQALPELLKLLEDPDIATRQQTLEVIGQLGAEAKLAIPDLIKHLDRADANAFGPLARALGQIGPPAKDALPHLAKWLDKDPPQARVEAATAMVTIDPSTQAEAMRTLSAVMEQKQFTPPIATLIPTLLRQGVPASEVVKLLNEYGRQSTNNRLIVVSMLAALASPPVEAAPLLKEWLKDAEPRLRQESAIALARFGEAGKEAAPVLRDLLQQRQPGTLDRAVTALGQLGPPGRVALPELLDLWRATSAADTRLRYAGAILAVAGDDKPRPVLDWLRQRLSLPDLNERTSALRVLAKYDAKNPDVLRALRRALREPQPFYGALAADLVGIMGEAGKSLVPELREMLADRSPLKRVRAAHALLKLEGKPEVIVPILRDALLEKDYPEGAVPTPTRQAAYSAAQTLGEFGAAAKPALPALREAMKLGDLMLRQHAAAAIDKIEKAK